MSYTQEQLDNIKVKSLKKLDEIRSIKAQEQIVAAKDHDDILKLVYNIESATEVLSGNPNLDIFLQAKNDELSAKIIAVGLVL